MELVTQYKNDTSNTRLLDDNPDILFYLFDTPDEFGFILNELLITIGVNGYNNILEWLYLQTKVFNVATVVDSAAENNNLNIIIMCYVYRNINKFDYDDAVNIIFRDINITIIDWFISHNIPLKFNKQTLECLYNEGELYYMRLLLESDNKICDDDVTLYEKILYDLSNDLGYPVKTLDDRDSHDNSLLHIRAKCNNGSLFNYVLNNNPNLVISRNKDGNTPLHIAVIYNNMTYVIYIIQAAQLLFPKYNPPILTEMRKYIDRGKNNKIKGDIMISTKSKVNTNFDNFINMRNSDGDTAIQYARHNKIIYSYLYGREADIYIKDNNGKNAVKKRGRVVVVPNKGKKHKDDLFILKYGEKYECKPLKVISMRDFILKVINICLDKNYNMELVLVSIFISEKYGIYSRESAYVSCMIASKYYYDDKYLGLDNVICAVKNLLIKDMERNMLHNIGWIVPNYNIMGNISIKTSNFILLFLEALIEGKVRSIRAGIIAAMLLYKRGKLKFYNEYS